MWGNVIRIKRERRGLSRGTLARLCGVSYRTYYDWERGRYQPNPTAKAKLMKALDLREEVFEDV